MLCCFANTTRGKAYRQIQETGGRPEYHPVMEICCEVYITQRLSVPGVSELPTGLFFFPGRHTEFLPAEKYRLLLKCDGAHDLDPDSLSEEEHRFLKEMEDEERTVRRDPAENEGRGDSDLSESR